MNNWLADSAPFVYLLAGTAALTLAVIWSRTRRGWVLRGAVGLRLLVGGTYLLRALYPPDSEQIAHVVQDMSAALQERNMDRIFAHISDSFSFHRHAKPEFRRLCEEVLRRRDVTECVVWDFVPEEVSRARGTGKISFNVKPRGNCGSGAESY